MKVSATDSFFTSLNKLARYDSWWYKTYRAIRYDIPYFFKNIWKFRKELYEHRDWDYRYTLRILYRSLTILENRMKDGLEVPESRDKKVFKIRRAIEILKHIMDDDAIERAELELGELKESSYTFSDTNDGFYELIGSASEEAIEHNRRVFNRSHQIETDEWNELWDIFKGQDINEYAKLNESDEETDWDDWFDGSDMRGWWD